ncbi:MAG: sensor histidine kinase, partial [Deltaproteobacteria bacterium]|nr:sensor histidine kinase [Deltaproteobacteria bacterium]
QELYFLGIAHADRATQKRAKEIRYPAGRGISGKVIKTGKPVIVRDTTTDPDFYAIVDVRLGFRSLNLLDVPLRIGERVIGVLCAANKQSGSFDDTDVEMMNIIASTVALSVENARVSEKLKKAYDEVTSLNRAKDRAINHLSHELRTPVAIIGGSLKLLRKRLEESPEPAWHQTMERAERNLKRIRDIEYEVEDIIQERSFRTYDLMSLLLGQCTDELETLVADETGDGALTERIRSRIEDLFGPGETVSEEVDLGTFTVQRLENLKSRYAHRDVEVDVRLDTVLSIFIPTEVLQKVVDGLIKNAIENTPDGGRIEVSVKRKDDGAELVVHDHGTGIPDDEQSRIFEGFFSTQDTMAYSTKRPFDFNAGGKGADLLRMRIFSERYHFKIVMGSIRCPCLTSEKDICPGKISECPYCREHPDCHEHGGTVFTIYFPPASGLKQA